VVIRPPPAAALSSGARKPWARPSARVERCLEYFCDRRRDAFAAGSAFCEDTAMTVTCRPLHPLFAAEASGIDPTRPLTHPEVAAFDAAMDRHAVLVLRDARMDQAQQIAFARSLGPLDLGLRKLKRGPHRFDYEELIDISNVGMDGRIVARESFKIAGNVANQLWHSDSSFQKPRARYSMLQAVTLPSWGGETEFADLRAAYDELPRRLKDELEGLEAEHYALHSRIMLGDDGYTEEQKATIPPVRWPLVQTHPGSGRKLLFVGVHCRAIPGMTLPEARMLIMDLIEHATQPRFVYRHEWRVGDLVVWDNRATLHRGRRYDLDERRELRRTTTEDVETPAPARVAPRVPPESARAAARTR
jgi:alpha-ketoglutarate-dependent 2,4-dichlorophenoxyacetate dioxygenase